MTRVGTKRVEKFIFTGSGKSEKENEVRCL